VKIRLAGAPATQTDETRKANHITGNITEGEVLLSLARVNTAKTDITTEDLSLNVRDLRLQVLEGHVTALAREINAYVIRQALSTGAYNWASGDAFTSWANFIAPTKTLSKNRSDGNMRAAILGPDTAFNFHTLDENISVNRSGVPTSFTDVRGFITDRGGSTWWENNPTQITGDPAEANVHTAGDYDDGNVTTSGVTAAAATTMNLTTVADRTGTDVKTGDLFTIAGVSQSFRVTNTTAAAGAGPSTITGMTFEPALPSEVADATAVTFHKPGETFEKNLMFDRGYAAAIVIPTSVSAPNLHIDTFVDPETGIGFTVQRVKQTTNNAITLNFEAYVGCIVVQPERGCLLV
jgi:hypothetical protein